MPRKPLGDWPTTAAERQQRRRDRIKAARPKYWLTDVRWLEDRLITEIENWRYWRRELTDGDIANVIQVLADRYRMQHFWYCVRVGIILPPTREEWAEMGKEEIDE